MSGVVARTRSPATSALRDIQAPVRDRLEDVFTEMQNIVTADLPLIREVAGHLLQMRGKMFRPTLTLLASDATGNSERRAIRLGAVIELMHLATLVHDDSVDHSALRRGLPTVNSLFSHQISVIMGDFLYSRALTALVGRDLETSLGHHLREFVTHADALTIEAELALAMSEPGQRTFEVSFTTSDGTSSVPM